MLDLKAKLLAAGVVTADQVKKVEDEQAQRRAREQERRDAERRRREEGPARGNAGHNGDRRSGHRGPGRDAPADRSHRERPPMPAAALDGAGTQAPASEATSPRPPRPRDTRSFKERRAEENLEKRARREHEWTQAMRWRERLPDLLKAGKSEQYAAIRGWVMKERLDNTQITEAAQRFFFTTYAGTLSHLTVEPDVHGKLVDGSAGIVAFIGYNGQEHAVVAADIATDVRTIKPEWLRHLIGVTDLEPPLVKPPAPDDAERGTDAHTDEAIAADSDQGLSEEAHEVAPPSGSLEGAAVDFGGNADDGAVTPFSPEPPTDG